MLALLLVIVGRVIVVQGFDPDGFASPAGDKRTQTSVLASERGSILDMNGAVLAQSVVRYDIVGAPNVNSASESFEHANEDGTVVVTSREFGPRQLADVLGQPENAIREALTGESKFN